MPLRDWWLVAMVLAAPLAAMPGVSLTQAKNAVVLLLGLGLVVWRIPSPWLQGLAAWAVLSVMVARLPSWGLVGLLSMLVWLLVYAEAARLSERAWRRVRWAMAGAAVIQLAWMGLQTLGVDPLFRPLTEHGTIGPEATPAVGWFANPMDTSLFLGLSLPALAMLSPWWLVPAAVAFWVLGATVGMLSLAVVALWVSPTWTTRAVIAGVLLLAGASFLILRDPQGLGYRPLIWRHGLDLAAQRPLFGWGPNAVGYRLRIVRANYEHWDVLFNEWLQGAVELGFAAPVLVLGYLLSLGRRLRRRWARCAEALPAVLVLVLMSAVSIPFRIGPVALLGALYLGRLEAVAQEEIAA